MKKDAEKFADEDKKKKEEIESKMKRKIYLYH